MVRTIIWTEKAQRELLEILKYWNHRNKSKSFSVRLNKLIEEQLNLISEFPKIGRTTDIPNVKLKVVHKYLLYYEIIEDVLYVLTLRHGSADPKSLKIR